MGYLDKLEISNRILRVGRARRKVDPIEYRRAKLMANIEEQIELALLAMQKKPLVLQRKRGHQVVKVRPRIWWKVEADGKAYTEIRYNKVPLKLDGRGTTIEVRGLKNLPTVYRTVISATKAGEVDNAIQTVLEVSSR